LEPLEERRLLAITVTTNLDIVDAADGVVSLREAIAGANSVAGPESIAFDFGHDGPATILLTMGALTIADSLTINGPGAQLLTIDASGNDPTPDQDNGDGSRIFAISRPGVDLADVTLRGLTLTGGDQQTSGGAISNLERLLVSDCTITGNAALGRDSNAPGGRNRLLAGIAYHRAELDHKQLVGRVWRRRVESRFGERDYR
jgi:hypothetical protein